MIENNTYQSALFITLARDAVERCTDPVWNMHAVTGIVMAFMSVEALINEVMRLSTILARQDANWAKCDDILAGRAPTDVPPEEYDAFLRRYASRTRYPEPEVVTSLAQALKGKDRKPTEERYDLILEHANAPQNFKSCEPRQSFTILASMRNYLVHCQSQETTLGMEGGGATEDGIDLGTVVERHPVPPFARYLETQGLVPKGTTPGPITTSFVHLLCTRQIAQWSCDVAASSARRIAELLPDCELKTDVCLHSMLGSRNLDRLSTAG